MRNLLLTLILIGNFLTCFSQDNFENAIVSLKAELEFIPTSETYTKENKPNKRVINQFKKCAEFEQLEKLNELNFGCIIKVKSSELYTSKWKGKWQIEFKEWEFKNEKCAIEFDKILSSLSKSRMQDCVNKGGIMWWKEKSKIYIVTSRAYFVTYHYKEIKEAIIRGLKK